MHFIYAIPPRIFKATSCLRLSWRGLKNSISSEHNTFSNVRKLKGFHMIFLHRVWESHSPSYICSFVFLSLLLPPALLSYKRMQTLKARLGGLPWWLRWWRICLQCRRPRFDLWVRKIPWRRNGIPLQYSCLSFPWTEEPGGLQSMGSQTSWTWLSN